MGNTINISDLLATVPKTVVIRHPDKGWRHWFGLLTIRNSEQLNLWKQNKVVRSLQPMGLGAWQLWKELQETGKQNDLDTTKKLLKKIVPDITDAELDVMTIGEAVAVIISAMGGIQPVLDALGKEQAQPVEVQTH